jgi:peptidoglycan hydrolase CwlO-like protein
MNYLHLILIVTIGIFPAISVAGENDLAVPILSFADISCGAWARSQRDEPMRQVYLYWFRGFVSGYNYGSETKQVPLNAMPDPDTLSLEDSAKGKSSLVRKKSSQEIQLEQLRNQLSDLQIKYTEKHPDILIVRKKIAELEDEIEKAKAKLEKEEGLKIEEKTLSIDPRYNETEDRLMLYVDKYCREHPLLPFIGAAIQLVKELSVKK